MARLLLAAASAALLASTSAAAAVLVVRSSGPSAAAYPPGKALADTHMLKLKASDTVVLLDSRGTRTLQRPRQFQRFGDRRPGGDGTDRRHQRPPGEAGGGPRRRHAQRLAGRSRPVGQCLHRQPKRADPLSRRCRQCRRRHADRCSGKSAKVHFEANQWDAAWPSALPVTSGAKINVSGLAAPATLTLRVLSPVPSGLEGMAQSLIRADCQAQLDVLINTFSARSEG